MNAKQDTANREAEALTKDPVAEGKIALDPVQAEEQARVAQFRANREAEARRQSEEADKPSGAGRIRVRQGQFIQLQGATWFRCTDVNQTLNRNLSAIAVALADFEYDASTGARNADVKNYTLAQFWQDPNKPQQAYTEAGLNEFLYDLSLRGKAEIARSIESLIRAGIKEFERQYQPRRNAA